MTLYRDALPQLEGGLFLVHTGMETDLIFNKGIDLPEFAAFPLLENEAGQATIAWYLKKMIDIAGATGAGVILESPTWVANRDRAVPLGYTPVTLAAANRRAVGQMSRIRAAVTEVPTVLSGNIGPRGDAYAPEDQMSADEARDYHAEQIGTFAGTDVDMVAGYTLAYPAEAIGMIRAAQAAGLPIAVSFTVETDGRLPTGATLAEAIGETDAATDGYASYFMVNCAHPDHFADTLVDAPWMTRIKGLVANASRCSHAELDEAEELDDGDPQELGQQLATIRERFPHLTVLGGCCGTDMRHIESIAKASRLSA